MKFLLDSNPIIYYLNQQLPPAGRAFVDQLTIDGAAYSVMTRLEVLGFRMLPDQRLRSERMPALFAELPIDDPVIETAITLRSTLKIKAMDALIASTALIHNLPLVTHNSRDFQAIAGLTLIDPFQP
ncbi:MAG: type II toxin-antitoxin system VapC family toxin [Synechococcaceae cyanobacterium]|nr:type II toxin-antitoxin system VapC family toxin [Synechococcaceae cyanobacterium]